MTHTTRTNGWLLLLALALGAALRLPAIFAGLPDATHPGYSYHPDEVYHLEWARWLYEGQFVPKQFMYGGTLHFSVLHAYAYYGERLGEALPGINALADTLIVGRMANVLFSLLTILLVARLGQRWFGARVGALAAVLLAVAPAPALLAGNVRPDTLATLLSALAMLTATRMLLWPVTASRRALLITYALGGVLLGAMIALRFPLAVFGVAMLAASWWREQGRVPWHRIVFGAHHWLLGVTTLIGYVVASPHTLAHPDVAWLGMRVQWAYQSGAFEDAIGRGPGIWQYGVRMLAQGMGWFLYPLALLGMVLALRVRDAGWMLWAGIVPYLLLTSFTSWVVVRYVMPLLPLLAIAAAWAVVEMVRHAQQRWPAHGPRVVAVLATGLVLLTALSNVSFLRQYWPRDTRDQAAAWLTEHAMPSDGVLMFWGYQGDVFFNPPLPTTLQQRIVLINEPLDVSLLAQDASNAWLVVNAATFVNMDRLGDAHPRQQVRDLAALLHAGPFELAASFEPAVTLAGVDLSAMFDSQDFQILNPGVRIYRRVDSVDTQ